MRRYGHSDSVATRATQAGAKGSYAALSAEARRATARHETACATLGCCRSSRRVASSQVLHLFPQGRGTLVNPAQAAQVRVENGDNLRNGVRLGVVRTCAVAQCRQCTRLWLGDAALRRGWRGERVDLVNHGCQVVREIVELNVERFCQCIAVDVMRNEKLVNLNLERPFRMLSPLTLARVLHQLRPSPSTWLHCDLHQRRPKRHC